MPDDRHIASTSRASRRAPRTIWRFTTSSACRTRAGRTRACKKLHANRRPFVLTRASYAGGQRYAASWTGDNSSNWNHLRQTIPQLLNLGLSGFALVGDDIGGFAASRSRSC